MPIYSIRTLGALLALAATPYLFGSAAARANDRHLAAPKDTVRVSLREWKLELSSARVPAGVVAFDVHNDGTMTHAFEVEGKGVEKSIPPIPVGAAKVVTMTLRPGEYEAYCPIGEGTPYAHKKMGMLSKLVLTGSDSR